MRQASLNRSQKRLGLVRGGVAAPWASRWRRFVGTAGRQADDTGDQRGGQVRSWAICRKCAEMEAAGAIQGQGYPLSGRVCAQEGRQARQVVVQWTLPHPEQGQFSFISPKTLPASPLAYFFSFSEEGESAKQVLVSWAWHEREELCRQIFAV